MVNVIKFYELGYKFLNFIEDILVNNSQILGKFLKNQLST